MWAAAAGAIAISSRCLQRNLDDRKIPLMGVLGAFIFAAQMINFAIPGTGSSGHLGGGMILAILLGPAAGFIVMASVLTVQALFFADGGLLALGGNIINLGAATCFIAYPLIFRPLAGDSPGRLRLSLACLLSAVLALQLGSLGVVTETRLSGMSDLRFGSFLLLMQPIHLAIGLIEGLVTALVVALFWGVRPESLAKEAHVPSRFFSRRVLIPIMAAALVCGGLLSGFASSQPDGLEWSLAKTASQTSPAAPSLPATHRLSAVLQEWTSVLPDYDFPAVGSDRPAAVGTSLSGLLGGLLTLLMLLLGGWMLRLWQRRASSSR